MNDPARGGSGSPGTPHTTQLSHNTFSTLTALRGSGVDIRMNERVAKGIGEEMCEAAHAKVQLYWAL